MLSCCVSAAADVDDITVITKLRDDDEHHHHHQAASAAGVSDCVQCAADSSHCDIVNDTHDTAADVSTHSDDRRQLRQLAASKTPLRHLDVEPSSPDDLPGSPQHSAAINLLLWKLTELERRITLGHHVSS